MATIHSPYLHDDAWTALRLLELAAQSPAACDQSGGRAARRQVVRRWLDGHDWQRPHELLVDSGESVRAERLRRLCSHGDLSPATWWLAQELFGQGEDRGGHDRR